MNSIIRRACALFPFVSVLWLSGGAAHGYEENEKLVTCGSGVKLRHEQSRAYYLNSVGHNWGAGSGQQVVTAMKSKTEPSTLWQVRGAHNSTAEACTLGTPIRCGQLVRLTHVQTKKNLHSHHIRSVLSGEQEVAGFGDEGEGDDGDNWKVVCDGKYWNRDKYVKFQHVQTRRYLTSSTSNKFNEQNCPHCPILGQLEVYGAAKVDRRSHFRAELGVYLSK